MAELLNDRIELKITTEELQAFATETGVVLVEGQTDLEVASGIIGAIDGMDDASWEAMTMALKEWSNTINNAKIEVAETIKKEEIAAKAQKTKKANAETNGAPTTPAAIKNAINACKNKAEIATAVSDIARACGCELPKITKGWTVVKQKEAAIAGLKKVKAPATTPAAPAKTPKPAGPVRTKAATPAQVKTQKAAAAATVADKAKGGGAIVDGEPFRQKTSGWIVWDIYNKSKAKGGVAIEAVNEKFEAGMTAAGLKSVNGPGRVKRVLAELKRRGLVTKLETGNFVLVRE